jgi:hypothetical protein
LIFSLLTAGVLVAMSASAGWILGRAARRRHEKTDASKPPQLVAHEADVAPKDPFEPFPFKLGDVLARSRTEDVVLTGALALRDGDSPAAMLFIGTQARDRIVMIATYPARTTLTWLEIEPASPADPPSVIDTTRGLLTRERRLPVAVSRIGEDAPEMGSEAMLYEYRDQSGQAAILLRSDEHAIFATGESISIALLTHTPV